MDKNFRRESRIADRLRKVRASCSVKFLFSVSGETRRNDSMTNDNELKQVQEPPKEEQQQTSTEQKPAEPPPPQAQLAEAHATQVADAPSENPTP
jgi:hypothetical protein